MNNNILIKRLERIAQANAEAKAAAAEKAAAEAADEEDNNVGLRMILHHLMVNSR